MPWIILVIPSTKWLISSITTISIVVRVVVIIIATSIITTSTSTPGSVNSPSHQGIRNVTTAERVSHVRHPIR
eukprot:1888591-Amphidinium_carterae.1